MPSFSTYSTAGGRISCLALLCLLCLPLLAGRAAARVPAASAEAPRVPVRYRVTDLGVAPGLSPLVATAISNTGWIVGHYGEEDFLYQAFAWKDAVLYQLTTLPSPFETQAQALAVNDAGVAAGWSENSFGLRRPVTWTRGAAPIDVTPGGEDDEEGFGINNNSVVVGRGSSLEIPVAGAAWQSGVRTLLPDLGGEFGEAYAINDSGRIVGFSLTGDNIAHACVWNSGVVTDLGTLGGFQSTAYAVNNPGLIGGSAETVEGALFPVLWDNTQIQPLPVPEDHYGEVLGLNNLGHAVGHIQDFEFNQRATRWIAGERLDLNDAIPSGSNWVLEQARDINDSGQIVGVGLHNGLPRSFLLAPFAADLSLTATAQSGPVLVGRNFTYTLQVTNQGTDASPSATLSVTLPENATFVSSTPAVTPVGGVLTFPIGALARNAVQTFTVTVQPAAAATLVLDAVVAGTEFDPDASDDHRQVSVTAESAQADLRVAVAANPGTGVVDSPLTYTLTVRNDGPHSAEGVTLAATLPAGVDLVSTTPVGTRVGDVLTFTLGTLATQGASTVTVVVEPSAAGELTFEVNVSAATPDPDPSDNSTSLDTNVSLQPGPDLVGAWQSLFARGLGAGRARRSSLTGTLEVRNAGTQGAGASVVRVYISTDALFDTGDAQVKELPVRALAAGESLTLSVRATGPRGVDANGRYVLARVDAAARVNETVETNNLAVFGPVPAQPDLTGIWQRLTVTASGTGARRRFTLRGSLQVQNVGADSKQRFVVRYLLSADTVPDAGDRKLRDAPVGSLPAGAVRALGLTVALPAGITVEGYHVLAVIDATAVVTETDETNNLTIHGPLP